uniref:Claudin n=1 Tax=Pogona vitticeps TaxID=103695 RepID=A0A6J0UDD5_9SAUR
MGSLSCQISALVLSFLGLIFLLIATVCNVWKFSSQARTLIIATWTYEGLWMSCATTSFGSVQCKRFSSLLSVDTHIQACRALMITSLILGVCGTLLTLLGLKCTQLGSSSKKMKTRIAMIGGVIFILGGLSSMVAVSWYAARITAQFFDSFYGGTKYELGYALYLGWAGSLLSILGGSFLTCSACKRKHRDQDDYRAGERRIYTKQPETITSAKDYV